MHTSIFFVTCFIRFAATLHALQSSESCDDMTPDCAKKASLCSNRLFEGLMRSRCKRTCGMCDAGEQEEYFEQIGGGEEEEEESYTEPTPEEETTDAIDEYPDAEEIDSNSETREVSPYSVRKSGSCIDLAQDCAEKINLCRNVQYNGIMARMCQRTCGLCDSAGEHGSISSGTVHSLASLLNCRDTTSDCQQRIAYCHNPQYSHLMSQICKKSCLLC